MFARLIEGLYKEYYIIIYNSIPRQTGERLGVKRGEIGGIMGEIGGIMGEGIDISRYL